MKIIWILFGLFICIAFACGCCSECNPQYVVYNITVLDKSPSFMGNGKIETEYGTMTSDFDIYYDLVIAKSYVVATEPGSYGPIIRDVIEGVD